MSYAASHSCPQPGNVAKATGSAMKRVIIMAGVAIALAGCGDTQNAAEELRNKADAAVDARGVADAIRSSVDEQAIKGMAADAIREELGPVGAVIDENALVSGVDRAVDGKAVSGAIGQAARDVAGTPASPETE